MKVNLLLFLIASLPAALNAMVLASKKTKYWDQGTIFEVTYPAYAKPCFSKREVKCIAEYKTLVNDSCNRVKHQLLGICVKNIDQYSPNELNPVFIIALKIHLHPTEQETHGNQPEELAKDEAFPALEAALEEAIRPICKKLQETTQTYKQFFSIKDDSLLQISLKLRIHKIIDEYGGKQIKERSAPIKEKVYEFH